MKTIYNIIFLLIISSSSFAQVKPSLEWFTSYDGLGNDNDFVNDIIIDDEFNTYLAGRSRGLDGSVDLLITKYNRNGDSLLNIRYFTTQGAWDDVNSIQIDSNGNIYALGRSSFGTSSNSTIFIKYSSEGEIIWQKDYFDSENASEGVKIVLDNAGNPIIAYHKYAVFSSINFTKFTSDGAIIWEKEISSDTTSIELINMISDFAGNMYIVYLETGYTGGDVYDSKFFLVKLDKNANFIWDFSLILFDADEPGKLMFDNEMNLLFGTASGRLIKINQDGDFLWQYNVIGFVSDFTTDNENNILLAGFTGGINSIDYLTTKINEDGEKLWIKEFNAIEDINDFFNCITSDKDDNIYVCGSTHNSIDFGVTYTFKYDREGNLIWKHIYDMPHSIFENPQKIFLDDSNNVMIAGNYRDSTNGSNLFLMMLSQKLKTDIPSSENVIPIQYLLSQNYPNPFNPTTTISYTIPKNGFVNLSVYNTLGEKVSNLVNEEQLVGSYKVDFNASSLTSGVYFYTLQTNDFVETKKLVLVK